MIRYMAVTLALACASMASQARIINGHPVDPAQWPNVLMLEVSASKCSAVVVGPRTVVTTAHCASVSRGLVTIEGKPIAVELHRHPGYSLFGAGPDIAVGFAEEDWSLPPLPVGDEVNVGDPITLVGFGCTQSGGGGGNDGVLREGRTQVTGFSGHDVVTRSAGGAALCYGDSGGPAVRDSEEGPRLIGVNSKGNIRDTNYSTHLGDPEIWNFLREIAEEHGTVICGVNGTC